MSPIWGMAKRTVAYDGDEILLCCKNDEQDDFGKSWKDLHELMQSEISRTRKTLYTVTEIV